MKPYDDCVYCGGAERMERVDYRDHGQLFILERVPTGVCLQCGEKYFTAAGGQAHGSGRLAARPRGEDGGRAGAAG